MTHKLLGSFPCRRESRLKFVYSLMRSAIAIKKGLPMKYILRISALAALCCVAEMQASDDKKVFIEIDNQVYRQEGSFAGPGSIRVALKQKQQEVDKKFWIAGGEKKLFYYLDQGPVTIMVDETEFGPYEANHLYGKHLTVNGEQVMREIKNPKTDKMESRLTLTPKLEPFYSTSLPKKKKIRGYKMVNRNQDWVVR